MCITGEFVLTLLIIKEKILEEYICDVFHACMEAQIYIYIHFGVCTHAYILMKQDTNHPNITVFFSNII